MVTHIVLRERGKTGSIRRNLWIPAVAAGASAGNLAHIMLRTKLVIRSAQDAAVPIIVIRLNKTGTAISMQDIMAWIEVNRFLAYGLVFAYCAMKSGVLPFFAGLAASSGVLDIAAVATATLLGGYLGDEMRLFIARRYGHKLSFTKPRLQHALKTTRALMDKYGAGYLFVYRYPKGMRTIGALPVGLTDIHWRRFTCLNAASAAVWATLLVGAGYLFGAQLADAMEHGWSLFSVVLLAVICITGWLMIRRLRATADLV
jgi:membrane protein DedA with SNARE-associated domain